MTDKPQNFTKESEWIFNQQAYNVEVIMFNNSDSIRIHPGHIIAVNMYESMYSIFPEISITLNNSGNVLENLVEDVTSYSRERLFSKSYNFNTDGKDSFYISISPKLGNATDDAFSERYSITGMFHILSTKEFADGASTKHKTFYLRDVKEQILEQSNIRWCSADAKQDNLNVTFNTSQVTNKFRKEKTGICLKHLLKTALSEDSIKFADDWDEGETEIFYSSSPQSTLYDDLEYILDRHVGASTQDNCLLLLDTRKQELSLRSIETYFRYGYEKDDVAPFIQDAFVGEAGVFTNH